MSTALSKVVGNNHIEKDRSERGDMISPNGKTSENHMVSMLTVHCDRRRSCQSDDETCRGLESGDEENNCGRDEENFVRCFQDKASIQSQTNPTTVALMRMVPPAGNGWSDELKMAMIALQQQHSNITLHYMEQGIPPGYAQLLAITAMQSQSPVIDPAIVVGHPAAKGTPYVWIGELPPRNYSNPVFSCKIFVGGVPRDVSEEALLDAFREFGPCRVEWPGKGARYATRTPIRCSSHVKASGYVYMIFEHEMSVKKLLLSCSQEFGSAGEWYFRLKAFRNQGTEYRQVQVIPWVVTDASYMNDTSCRFETSKTVFVGALHGMITAQVLYSIMNELYGNVIFVGIDTDKYKYPIGSGRVTFCAQSSYFRAVESGYLEIRTSKFVKRIQIDPFLEEAKCSMCDNLQGPYFCRDRNCFRYFCMTCWKFSFTN